MQKQQPPAGRGTRPEPRHPHAESTDVVRRGNTIPAQGQTQDRAPRLPHERDESADSQPAVHAANQQIGSIAHADVERGLVDTDKGPALDAAYDKVREGAQDPVKKFRP